MKKLISRKFWITVSALGAIIFSAINGSVTWADAMPSMAAIVIGYCVAQGWIDGREVIAEADKAIQGSKPSTDQ